MHRNSVSKLLDGNIVRNLADVSKFYMKDSSKLTPPVTISHG